MEAAQRVLTSRELFVAVVEFLPGQPRVLVELARRYREELHNTPAFLARGCGDVNGTDWWHDRLPKAAVWLDNLHALQVMQHFANGDHSNREAIAFTITSATADLAAARGRLAILQWMRAKTTLDIPDSCMESALAAGHIQVAEWLEETFGERMTAIAMTFDTAVSAKAGHLDVLQYLHRKDQGQFTTRTMDSAASSGHLALVQFLHEHRTEGCTASAIDGACSAGHLDIVQWLFECRHEGCSKYAIRDAALNNHVHVIRYLWEEQLSAWPCISHHVPLYLVVAAHGSRENVEYAVHGMCLHKRSPDMLLAAAKARNINAIAVLLPVSSQLEVARAIIASAHPLFDRSERYLLQHAPADVHPAVTTLARRASTNTWGGVLSAIDADNMDALTAALASSTTEDLQCAVLLSAGRCLPRAMRAILEFEAERTPVSACDADFLTMCTDFVDMDMKTIVLQHADRARAKSEEAKKESAALFGFTQTLASSSRRAHAAKAKTKALTSKRRGKVDADNGGGVSVTSSEAAAKMGDKDEACDSAFVFKWSVPSPSPDL